ncbi:hypothetical protein HPB49_003982 [Dermacentor silvarum]|uniref:Uncharacterized protein n=1 Tax=Dermacentor silvarum TaxID=543639 RepID=A0ACB8CPQ6_DERSI|nr:hypothetical protein HPB49_003982 [Dermacentor silvarum]
MDDTDRSSEASGNSNESGRAHELKLEIEALRIQLEIEKLKSSRVLQDAAQARSESSGIGKYAKDLRAVLAPMPTNDTMIPAWFKNADSLLRTFQIPEEMQGALILPFLSDTSSGHMKLTGAFGQAVTADIMYVPLGLPCPLGNATQRVPLLCAVTPALATSTDVLLTPDDYESLCLAVDESGRDLESGECAFVEESPEQEGTVARRYNVDSAAHTS